ncbi:MAG: metalloregulator ArsR/SmtB family transcription factor [Actinomycetota bacterium]
MASQAVLEAVSSPRRREILRLVWDGERSSGEIAAQFPASWPSISRSLRALREAGVVRERRKGQQRFYRADRVALKPLEKFLTELWETGLDKIASDMDKKRRRR